MEEEGGREVGLGRGGRENSSLSTTTVKGQTCVCSNAGMCVQGMQEWAEEQAEVKTECGATNCKVSAHKSTAE